MKLRNENIRGFGAAGASHDSPRALTCTFEGPDAVNTTKIPREDPQREKKTREDPPERGKERKWERGRGKKSAKNIGPPPPFGPPVKCYLRICDLFFDLLSYMTTLTLVVLPVVVSLLH